MVLYKVFILKGLCRMRIIAVLFLLSLSILHADPWGVHALIRDPTKGTLYFQWFDAASQGGAVKIQESGAELFTAQEPTETDYGSPKWRLYRLELALAPNTTWKLQVGENAYFVKVPPKALPLKLAVGGDMLGQKGRFQRMNEVVQEESPDLIVMGGDLGYALGRAKQSKAFKVAIEQWENFFAIASEGLCNLDGSLIPWLVVVGNHDYRNDEAGALFFKFFPSEDRKAKRVVDFVGLSIFALDTGHVESIEGEQTEWLKKQLASRQAVPWKLAAYHIGAYPSYYSTKGDTPERIRKNWCPLFEEAGVVAAFEHHSHCYKRTYPLINGVASPKGVTYFGDGCWGVQPRKFTFDAEHFAKAARINHIYIVDVLPSHIHVKAVSDEGTVFDGAQFSKTPPRKS